LHDLAAAVTEVMKDSLPRRTQLLDLMKQQNAEVPVTMLFTKPALRFSQAISAKLTEDQQRSFFSLLADPTRFVLTGVLESDSALSQIKPAYQSFVALDPKGMEGVLHHLAIRLYRTEGPDSVGAIKQMVIDADTLSEPLGIFYSFILFLPLFLSA